MGQADQVAAFRAYGFDKDADYQRYMQSVELPATNLEQAMLKVKAKWWKREKDADFNLEWVTAAAGARPSPTPSYTPSSSQPPPSSYSKPAPKPMPQAASFAAPPVAKYAGRPMDQLYITVANMGLIILAIAFVQPFLGRRISLTAYNWFLLLLLGSSLHRLLLRFKRPAFTFAAVQAWAPAAMTSNEGLSALVGFLFRSHPPVMLLLAPPLVSAVFELSDAAAVQMAQNPMWIRFGAAQHKTLLARRRDVLLVCAASEVAVGIMLFLQLLTPSRNIMLLFLYWHLLKARLFSRDSGPMHMAVWRMVGQYVRPQLAKVPALATAVGYAERWFVGGRV